MKNVIKFRVYPESVHGFYFDVEVHPTVGAMRKAADRCRHAKGNFSEANAAVCGLSKGRETKAGRAVWTKTKGTMFFNRERLGTEVIAHESTHAALRWMEAHKFDATDQTSPDSNPLTASDNEERFCYAVGRIASQIAGKCWENDLYS